MRSDDVEDIPLYDEYDDWDDACDDETDTRQLVVSLTVPMPTLMLNWAMTRRPKCCRSR